MVLIVLVVLLAILLLSSCGTKKTITEYIEIHDTTEIVRTDTLRDVRVITQHDSTHHETERIITLMAGDSGRVDTVKEVINNTLIKYFERTDSADRYRAVADSLRKVLDKEREKDVVKKRIPDLKDFIFFAVFIVAILFFLRKIK